MTSVAGMSGHGDDWSAVQDAATRRRIQNRIAQRVHSTLLSFLASAQVSSDFDSRGEVRKTAENKKETSVKST